jgi:neutral ceramidase
MSGLAMRLYSRTFVIEQPGVNVVAIATADQLHMYQSVKVGVVKRLATLGYGGVFNTDNVMISATHTHAATSNISWYTLFNLFNGVTGFDTLHYEVVVRGITQSIVDAYNNRQAATIKSASGMVPGGAYNRSTLAYLQNMDIADYPANVDERMTLLRFDGVDGSEIGALNWFAVHGTSLGITNRRTHGDNKGYAAYQMEKLKGGDFVAAFAQGAMGDASPNEPNPNDITLPFLRPSDQDSSLDVQENPIVAGGKQLNAAMQLHAQATDVVPVALDYRHSHVNFNNTSVQNQYIGQRRMPWDTEANAGSCVGVIGGGFLAGDEEGAPVEVAPEGEIRNDYTLVNGEWVQNKYDLGQVTGEGLAGALGALWPIISSVTNTTQFDACHKEKAALLPVGDVSNFYFVNPNTPFVPVVIPFQIIKIGDTAVLGTPFEMTTMTGRRLREAVEPTLANAGVTASVLAGMVNSYGQYLTTREEYSAQHFEGAFTIYGPWAQAAVAQQLDRLASDLAAGTASAGGPNPPDLSTQQIIQTWISSNGVVSDGGNFGAVLSNANASYSRTRATVQVDFRAAHPRTVLAKKIDGSLSDFYDPDTFSFLEVQKKVGSSWQTVAKDGDPYTTYDWIREGDDPNMSLSDRSTARMKWLVRNQPAGTYRIKYNGLSKQWFFWWPRYNKFTGYSREFQLQ